MRLFTPSACLLTFFVVSIPGVAMAQSAEDLIKQGKDLVEQGKVDDGCALIFQAENLKPTVDSIGLVAACHEKQGKLAAAYREYMTTADRAGKTNDDRQKFALDQAAALEKRIGRVTVKAAAGETPKITVAGEAYTQPYMVDPGTVTVAATEPSGKSWKSDVTVIAGQSQSVDVPTIATWGGGGTSTPPPPTEKHYASGPPTSAVVAGTIGIVGLGMMAGGGIAAIVLNNSSKNATSTDAAKLPCRTNDTAMGCDSALKQHNQAATASIVADVGLGVGVVGVGLAAIFWGAHVGAKTVDEKQARALPVDFVPVAGGGAVVWRGEF